MIASFKQRLGEGNLTPEEQVAMINDLNAKMAQINNALESE
jgi:hypothetical protein